MAYSIRESRGHGKACNGAKKTSTIQVIEPNGDGYFLVKQFRFKGGDFDSKRKAINKAKTWIKENDG